MNAVARMLLAVCVVGLATSCTHMGPARLRADQVDYARALGTAKKRAILDAMVQLRFADAPSFLTVSQIIAAYTLRLPRDTGSFEVVYGQSSEPGKIARLTRSVLGILNDLGAQVEMPASNVASVATKPTVGLVGGETRPTIIVHSAATAPADAYVSIPYDGTAYWIARDDFDSKYAFTVVQDLMALAEADTSAKAPIVTIPAD